MTLWEGLKAVIIITSLCGVMTAGWIFLLARRLRHTDANWRDDPRLQVPWIRPPGKHGLRDLIWGEISDFPSGLRQAIWICRTLVATSGGAILILISIRLIQRIAARLPFLTS